MQKHSKPLNINQENLPYPFGYTLAAMTGVCVAVYAALFIIPEYVGALVLIIGVACGIVWIIAKVRQAFTFGSHNLADFVAGKTKRKPLENPLMTDPFYASIDAQITEAKARHRRVKHLYAKREHRVNELLGMKGAV